MAAIPTSFDGLSVNGATDYLLVLNPYGQDSPLAAGLTERRRQYQTPVIDAIAHEARRVPFIIYLKPGAATSAVTFRSTVNRYFTPHRRGKRTILATHQDGSTTLTEDVYVTGLTPTSYNAFRGEMVYPRGTWKGTTVNSDSSSPCTVSGEHPALPSLAIAMTSSTLKRREIQIDDECTRGLSNYPVAITFDSTGVSATTAANYVVMYAGRSIPFKVLSPNNGSTKIWVRIDAPPNGSAYLDIYYGSSVNNTVTADTYDRGGMDLTNSTNTSWVWDEPYTVSTNPKGACGVWTAVKGGRNVSGIRYGISSESGTQLDIDIAPDATGGALANDADGIVLTIGTGAGTSNALTGLSRDDVNSPTGNYEIFCNHRTANQVGWSHQSIHTGGAAQTGAIDVDNAVQIMIAIQPTDNTADATLRLALSGSLTLALNSSITPTVTVGSATTARYIDGTITNSTTGDTIDFDQVYIDDGATLTIDTEGETMTLSSGPMHTTGNGIVPSNPPAWFELAVGSNSWTLPSGMTMTVTWQDRYYG